MDYSMQGSKDSYSPQVHNLYPHAQPGLYPPPPPPPPNPPAASPQYQGYFAGAAAEHSPYSHPWSEQPGSYDAGPLHYRDDADCITFLRGCLAGLCCCWLLEHCCI